MDILPQVLINGIFIGSFYSLIAMGLNIIFGVMKVVNFCQGELLMIGMYCSYLLIITFGMNPYLTPVIVIIFMFIIGGLIQFGLITPVLSKGGSDYSQIFLTVGLGLLFQNLALLSFSSNYRTIQIEYSTSLNFLGQIISLPKLISFIALLIVSFFLYFFLSKTDLGKKIRATSQNPLGARLVGINDKQIYIITYGIGAALAGTAGALLLPFYFVFPLIGEVFQLRAFVVVVLGGLGSIKGAFFGGIILGLLETMGAIVVGPSLKDSIVFLSFILILIIREVFQSRQG
jgi:branched-chain amino acid transport system permease protein